jgi:hypothetical protein
MDAHGFSAAVAVDCELIVHADTPSGCAVWAYGSAVKTPLPLPIPEQQHHWRDGAMSACDHR